MTQTSLFLIAFIPPEGNIPVSVVHTSKVQRDSTALREICLIPLSVLEGRFCRSFIV
jgi:hypothetical protein